MTKLTKIIITPGEEFSILMGRIGGLNGIRLTLKILLLGAILFDFLIRGIVDVFVAKGRVVDILIVLWKGIRKGGKVISTCSVIGSEWRVGGLLKEGRCVHYYC
jgi:hypothetical protein